MKYKRNKFVIFYVFNIILLLVVLVLAIPVSKFLSKINLDDNEFVSGQSIINPNAKSPKVLNRTMEIEFLAKVDSLLEWDFKTLQNSINRKSEFIDKKLQFYKDIPLFSWIEISPIDACNRKCVFCPKSKSFLCNLGEPQNGCVCVCPSDVTLKSLRF